MTCHPLGSFVKLLILLLPLSSVVAEFASPNPEYHILPPLREQAKIQDVWTRERRANIPGLLQKYGIDAWLISQREYAEETVFWSLKAATQFSARRRTTMLFLADPRDGVSNTHTWIDNTPKMWEELRALLAVQNPRTIAINTHPQIAFSSGLHAGELDALRKGLGKGWAERFVSEPMLAVGYIATMPTSRREWYHKLQSTAWAVIDEAFSEKVISPGQTTTVDVEWWLREKLQQLNYTTWFHPDVSIINRHGWHFRSEEPPSTNLNDVIRHGDMLHVDFGLTALGLNTDTQHLAYVLHPGQTEGEIPRSLREGLKKGNRAQDIVISHMKIGRTGNEILRASLEQMRREGIEGKVYCHPIGDWGHSAGTLIGMTNLQEEVPVLGDLPLLAGTYYSIELLVNHFVPEWNTSVSFPLEEDVVWDWGGASKSPGWKWAFARQERFHVVKSVGGAGTGDVLPGDL